MVQQDLVERGFARRTSEVLVASAQHRREGSNLLFATANFAGLFEIALGAHVADDAFAVELLLQAAKGPFHGLAFADFDFNGHNCSNWKKGE